MATTEYPKINAPFHRDMEAPGKPLIVGRWSEPEFEYLQDNEWEFTEKVDGTNIRIVIERVNDYIEWRALGRTDNAQIPAPLMDTLKGMFNDSTFIGGALFGGTPIEQLQGTSETVVLYGEGYGPKIQSGGKYRSDQSFVLFDVKFGPWWLSRENVNDIAKKLKIESVPVVGYGTLNQGVEMVRRGLDSIWGDFEAEGVVARPAVPLFNRKGNRITTKIKARDFK